MRILILTEDGALTATKTIEEVFTRLLRAAYPRIQTNKVDFLPRPLQHKRIMSGNKWRSEEPRDREEIIALARDIATEAAVPDGFVIFHFDGDTAWTHRASAITPSQFESKIVSKSKKHVHDMTAKNPKIAPFNDEKIIRFVPYYAIEAWLFQNFDECERLATEPADRTQLALWRNNRGLLDEHIRPHEKLSIGKTRNLPLAKSLSNATVRDVVTAGKSLAQIVERLQCNAALNAAVARISLNAAPVGDIEENPQQS